MPRYVNPNSKGFDSNARCEYHSNTQGHSTENCWTLKKAIENLIEAKAIVDYKQSGKTEMIVRTIGPEPKVIVSPPQLAPLMVKGASSSLNLACSEKTIFYVPGSTKKVEVQLGGPKLYIPGGIQKIIPNNGLRNITEPVMIRPVAQLLVTNTKAIPWNYNKTVMTYKGKEIVEETGEMGGLTRSGRCYSPEELRKAKQARESHLPVKEPVAEKEAEEFLKKMKLQDYSIIDQLRKTPAQISLLSLLLHSEEHRRVLIKTLNEAYVSEKTTVNQLEKMAERFFEVNRITFSDDDLPEEGAGHNRALHLMVKCEGHYVKGVMIDGGSSVDVCPLSTLQQLNIDTNRIRTSNVSIRAFDGSKRDTIGEIELTMTICPVDFNIIFQVLDMETSYNFLLGRPWIHVARAAKEGCESIIYQAFGVIEVDQVEEGKPILHPRLSATSMMVASLMLRNGYEPGKGLGSSLQGIVNPIALFSKKNTFGLGFKPTSADIDRAKARKKNGWNLSKPIPHIAYSFVKPQFEEVQNPSTQDDIDGVCQGLKEMFYEINMVQVGEGPSRASVQLIGPDTSLSNWE
uniref:G-patch domain-containing protein n=1 Tax=Nicotiana tabacum TaxID=4097 RepID=A0A1S4AC81_TOBAC